MNKIIEAAKKYVAGLKLVETGAMNDAGKDFHAGALSEAAKEYWELQSTSKNIQQSTCEEALKMIDERIAALEKEKAEFISEYSFDSTEEITSMIAAYVMQIGMEISFLTKLKAALNK